MQFYPLFYYGPSSGPNGHISEPAIEGSDLYTLIKNTFAQLGTPPRLVGVAKLAQRQNNPDAFDLYFLSSVGFGPYEPGGTYSAPEIATFERMEFEQFPAAETDCRRRLQEFTRRLVLGELLASHHE